MPTTITAFLPSARGDSTARKLYLISSAGAILNSGGDALTEAGEGVFTCSVDETIAADYLVDIRTDSSGKTYAQGVLYNGQTVVDFENKTALNSLANITTQVSTANVTVSSSLSGTGTLELYNHDSHDGTNRPLIPFTVDKDYTGETVQLKFWKRGDSSTVYKTATAVVASSTLITVDVDIDFGSSLSFSPCDAVAEIMCSLVAIRNTDDEETIVHRKTYITDRPSFVSQV